MSRCCEITTSVSEYNTSQYQAIIDAVGMLEFDAEVNQYRGGIVFDPEIINVPTECTEESVAREIVEAIWKANGAFCKVQVEIRDLDANPPLYSWGEASFDAFHKGG